MTWTNRLRLLGGLMVVLFVVAGSTVILNQREARVASTSASIMALSYSIGSDYAGIVTEQEVQQGDLVERGDPILTVQSPSLAQALASDLTVPASNAYVVSDEGMLTLVATESGIVSRIDASVGGFVAAGQPLATIDRGEAMYALADFRLDPYDFGRIETGARVELVLPDHSRVDGAVSGVRVETVDGQADAAITIASDGLVMGGAGGLVASGTPVTAIMHLRDDGPLAGVRSSYLQFLEQVGI